MVATATLERELACARLQAPDALVARRRRRDVPAARRSARFDLPRPIFLTCGRLAVEKNLGAFLSLDLPGSKLVVGDGPARRALETRFPQAHFAGALQGEALAAAYASADVFVFPSLTDTFGIVLLEALASGLPVAGFPVAGTDRRHRRERRRRRSITISPRRRSPRSPSRARRRAPTRSPSAGRPRPRQFIDNVQSAHAKDARFARRSWLRRRRVAAPSLPS